MLDRIADEMSFQDFLNLVTEFYCSLSVRKHMQNITSQIREFIFLRKDVINKELFAKKILDFFLRIQSQLRDKSDKQWDQAFQIQMARAHALIKICDFSIFNSYRNVFNKLKYQMNQMKRPQALQIAIISNTQQLITNCNIEVEKDIKTKTFYFFKWCQYTQQSKAIKQLKKRQVENQKISSSFNKYGLKSNSFNAWKIYYKKTKHQKQKAKMISTKCKQQLLRTCLLAIQQASEIITVQSQLTRKVKQTIICCKKKNLFKKLKHNQQIIKKRTKSRHFSNQSAHQFLHYLSRGLKPTMNKSFQLTRNKLQNQNKKLIIMKYFKQFKKLCTQTQSKINLVKLNIKLALMNEWRCQYNQRINFNDKSQKFQSCLSFRRRRVTLTLLSLNRLLRKQQFKKIQTIMQSNQNALTHRSFIQVNAKRQVQDRKIKIMQNKILKQKLNLFSSLKLNLESSNKSRDYNLYIKKSILKTLISRFCSYKSKLTQKYQILEQLKLRNQKNQQQQAFRRWRRLKSYHKYEQLSLGSMMKLNKKVIMMSFWNKFINRAEQKCNIQKFVSATKLTIIKIAYSKLLGRTLFINNKIKKMKQITNKKLKQNLFNLLIKNQQYNTNRSKIIQNNFAKRCQKILIKKLKQLIKQKNITNNIKIKLQNNKMKLLFTKLKILKKQNNNIFNKTSIISKKLFISYFQRSIKLNVIVNQRNQYKNKILQNRIKQLRITRFIDQLKRIKNIRQIEQDKQNKIIFKFARKQIIKIKQNIKQIKLLKRIKQNQNILIKNRLQDCFKIITQKYKINSLINHLNYSQKQNIIIDFIKFTRKSIKIHKNSQIFSQTQYKRNSIQFIEFLTAQKKQMSEKLQKLQHLKQTSQIKKSISFLNLLKQNKQNIENIKKLLINRKHTLFSQYIATNLRNKFNKIKFNCSLKMYAKNLMKKALKGLKNSHNKLKQKQNLVRLDKTSSIIMQKSIERSFKSHTLSQQIQKFNLRKSRQMR